MQTKRLLTTLMLLAMLILSAKPQSSLAEPNLQPELNRDQNRAIVICGRELMACHEELYTISDPGPKIRDITLSVLIGLVVGAIVDAHYHH